MLKINKILLKKIKLPLSLRGMFPFCHSRESGNPSFLSLRGAKRRSNLNHNGFSLIELMIAVTILALAIFGIFHAYSVGFLGIADARDRTVATNYAREAMEDVKNMDFEKIVTITKSVITSNIKYRVDVNVSLENENPNLKKVFTVVSWKDRNGVGKTVETSMLVNYTEIYASAAAKIVLFADSYTILSDSTTNITAVIKDIKGNTVIGWDGEDISFSIQPVDESGNLINITTTTNGIAEATFTYNGPVGIGEVDVYVIEASVTLPPPNGNVVSDSVTIKVTDGPVKITLTADPDIIKAGETSSSIITVSLCDAENVPLPKSELGAYIEITFNVFGEGNLSSSTITIPNTGEELAIATIDLYSTGNPGLASVVATATNLESGTTDVRFLGPPDSISISANPNPIYVDDIEGSTVLVILIDENGFITNPISGNITISLALSTNPYDPFAYLESDSLVFYSTDPIGASKTTKFKGQSSVSTANITASAEGLSDNSVTINILSALVPDHIKLTASSQNVVAGGTSTIIAKVYDGNKIVTNYIGTITFETTLGVFSTDNNTIIVDVNNGEATTVLTSSSAFPGNAIITIIDTAPTVLPFNPSDGLVIGFYGGVDHIELTASSQNVVTGGSSIITATVCDSEGITVTNYAGTINFVNTGIGTFISDNLVTITNGIATIELYSEEIGTATITASSLDGLLNSLGSIEVEFHEEIALILVDGSVNCTPTCDIITFDVIVAGDDIEVDEMKIIWTESGPQERFSKIVIDSVEVYTGGSDKSATIVDISNETLGPGEYSIELTFIQDMAGRHIDVMFYPPITGWYLIRFDVP